MIIQHRTFAQQCFDVSQLSFGRHSIMHLSMAFCFYFSKQVHRVIIPFSPDLTLYRVGVPACLQVTLLYVSSTCQLGIHCALCRKSPWRPYLFSCPQTPVRSSPTCNPCPVSRRKRDSARTASSRRLTILALHTHWHVLVRIFRRPKRPLACSSFVRCSSRNGHDSCTVVVVQLLHRPLSDQISLRNSRELCCS